MAQSYRRLFGASGGTPRIGMRRTANGKESEKGTQETGPNKITSEAMPEKKHRAEAKDSGSKQEVHVAPRSKLRRRGMVFPDIS